MNLAMINLILAFFWLAVAVVLVILQLGGQAQGILKWRLDVVALVLALYNFVRWWSARVAETQRRQSEQAPRKPSLRRAGDDRVTPDPNFIFDDPPSNPVPPAGNNGIGTEPK